VEGVKALDGRPVAGSWYATRAAQRRHGYRSKALNIVRQFNDPRLNSRNAQLVFTTHDTNLLGTTTGAPPLRRDQTWLTEKDAEGASCIYPLTDYKPRKSENLERGYLQGRYGSIPFLGALVPGVE